MSNGGSPTPTSINAITRASTNSKTSTRNQPKYQEGKKFNSFFLFYYKKHFYQVSLNLKKKVKRFSVIMEPLFTKQR